MTVVRGRHNSRFAALPNAIWEDDRISVEAKGVLGYLLSRAPDWHVRTDYLRKELDVGKDKLHRIFRELISAGYMTREQPREATGAFDLFEYVVRDEPETVASLPQPENPAPVNPEPVKAATYKERKVIKTDSTKDAADDARANEPSRSLISPEAFALSADLMRLQRLDADDFRCIAAAYSVQAWLSKGWNADVIRQAVETVMARRTSAPQTLRYFEKAIVELQAERARPLPTANPPAKRNHNGTHRQGGLMRHAIKLAEQASDDRYRSDHSGG